MNSAASLAASLPVGRHSAPYPERQPRPVRPGLVVAAYALPAAVVWALLGWGLSALPLDRAAWILLACYGCCYGAMELARWPLLPPPGRRWQVPQTLLIDASPRRRVMVWGVLLGPGFATRNPYAGFALLPLAVAAMGGIGAGVALGAAVGVAHGAARALALIRDIQAGQRPEPAGQVDGGHLDLLLRTLYWRRLDGWLLLAAAVIAIVALGHHIR